MKALWRATVRVSTTTPIRVNFNMNSKEFNDERNKQSDRRIICNRNRIYLYFVCVDDDI